MMNYISKYGFNLTSEEIERFITSLHDNIEKWNTPSVLSSCLGFIDLTTLKVTDTYSKVTAFVNKVNEFKNHFPKYPTPASICVYPNFSKTVKDNLMAEGVHITAVSGCFPASQSFIEVKELESKMAVESGANEIDIVLALNNFLDGNYDGCINEITSIKKSIGKTLLKVILETGALTSIENIADASFLAMESGADFIKTSTGKIEPSATPAAAMIMCECIKLYHAKTGKKIGFKPAGGISTAKDAIVYYAIVDTILGKEWLTKERFRLGASRVANSILTELEQNNICYY